MSLTLFNVYSEEAINKALENETAEIKIKGHHICTIRYTDDTVFITENVEGLQRSLGKVIETSEEFDLLLNTKKAKFMIITKNSINNIDLMQTKQYTIPTIYEQILTSRLNTHEK